VTRGRTGDFLSRFVKAARRSTISAFRDFGDRKTEVTEYSILSISNSGTRKSERISEDVISAFRGSEVREPRGHSGSTFRWLKSQNREEEGKDQNICISVNRKSEVRDSRGREQSCTSSQLPNSRKPKSRN
jgi:hypothetical protein